MGAKDSQLSKNKIRFRDIPPGTWFRIGPALYQRLKNFNGSNCYQWDTGYSYIGPSRVVVPVRKPKINLETKERKLRIIGHLYEDMTMHLFPPEQ